MNTTHEVTTTIAKGQPAYKGRKYLGQFYVGMGLGKVAHSSNICTWKRHSTGYRRLPVYQDADGTWWYAGNDRGGEQQTRGRTTVCEHCPTLVRDWMEEAACFGVMDTRFGDGDTSVIAEYCDACPVVLDCFEYGAAIHRENAGTIWGGLLFPKSDGGRRQAIINRRKEL